MWIRKEKTNIIITKKPLRSKERAIKRIENVFNNAPVLKEKLTGIFFFMSSEYIKDLSYISFITTHHNNHYYAFGGDLILGDDMVIISTNNSTVQHKVNVAGETVGNFYAKEVCRILETRDPNRYLYSDTRDFSIDRLREIFEGELYMVEKDTEITARRVFNKIIYNQPVWVNDLWIIRSGTIMDMFFKSYKLSVSIWVNGNSIYYCENVGTIIREPSIIDLSIMKYKISGIKELEERIEKRRDSLR